MGMWSSGQRMALGALFAAAAALAGCGGDSDASSSGAGAPASGAPPTGDATGGQGPAPTPSPAPMPAPVPTTSAVVKSVDLVQSFIFSPNDSLLKVVAGKALLVKVNATNVSNQAVPEGSLVVRDAQGAAQFTTALAKPASLPQVVPAAPNFKLAYTALVPAEYVKEGLSLAVQLNGNGQSPTVVQPSVKQAASIRIVGVRVKHSDSPDATALPVSTAPQLLDRFPVSAVNYSVRAASINLGKPNAEVSNPDGRDVFSEAMNAVGEARVTDGKNQPDTFYYGFVYWAAYGGVGVGLVNGRAAAGWDRHGDTGAADSVRDVWVHETGHNFGLGHAPSQNDAANADYPYAGGLMGDGSRAVWTYMMSEGTGQTLRDPLQTRDVMSYSGPSYGRFSDVNYMKAFDRLSAAMVKAKAAAAPAEPQDMLLLSGTVQADGQAVWRPARRYRGAYTPADNANASLRVTSLDGSERTYPVALLPLSDDSGRRAFMLGVPYASSTARVELLGAGGRVMGTLAGSVAKRKGVPAGADVAMVERGGRLAVTWNASAYPYLTISHVLQGARTTIAVNLTGGRAEIDARDLPAGGCYEFALSDGLNGELVVRGR